MEKQKVVYPIRKTDNLGRQTYVDWNGVERTIYKYWGDTKKIKVKYRLYHQEASFDAYDRLGKTIMSYASGTFEINLPRVWSDKNGDISFRTSKRKLLIWTKIAKSKGGDELFKKFSFNPFF